MYRSATLAIVVSSTSMKVGTTTAAAMIQGLIATRRAAVGAITALDMAGAPLTSPEIHRPDPERGLVDCSLSSCGPSAALFTEVISGFSAVSEAEMPRGSV